VVRGLLFLLFLASIGNRLPDLAGRRKTILLRLFPSFILVARSVVMESFS
jgi:hypothetical protein